RAAFGSRKPSRLVPRCFGGDLPALLLRGDGYPRGDVRGHPRKHGLRRRTPAAAEGDRIRLSKAGSARLVIHCGRIGQDLPDPAPPGGTIPVVGWTVFWWRGLLPWLRCWSSYVRRHIPGAGGPHRSALCWAVCGAVLEQDALVGKAGSFGAGIDYPASGHLVFIIRRIREKERYSRKGRNSVCRENAISEHCKRYPQAFLSICQPLRDHGICLLP